MKTTTVFMLCGAGVLPSFCYYNYCIYTNTNANIRLFVKERENVKVSTFSAVNNSEAWRSSVRARVDRMHSTKSGGKLRGALPKTRVSIPYLKRRLLEEKMFGTRRDGVVRL